LDPLTFNLFSLASFWAKDPVRKLSYENWHYIKGSTMIVKDSSYNCETITLTRNF